MTLTLGSKKTPFNYGNTKIIITKKKKKEE
jgi:hypothetical protein